MRNLWKNGRIETKMKNQTPIIIMNFSGIYKEEDFYKGDFWKGKDFRKDKEENTGENMEGKGIFWMELQDIPGTNCYCDEEAIAEINKRTENLTTAGIHFIDSGNYHYMTRLWLAKMEVPFALLVFDNHTDMQPPAFGGLLSCGGWIAAALEELEDLCHVILIGPDEAAYEQVDEGLKEKVSFLSREQLQKMEDEEIGYYIRTALNEKCGWEKQDGRLSLYISIDKDVLCPSDAQTTWSQGDMSLDTLLSCVQTVRECAKECQAVIAGVDICGEADMESVHENQANDLANQELLKAFLGSCEYAGSETVKERDCKE